MEENTMQEKTCCVTGYRDIPADKLNEVRRELEREVKAALEDGYREFLMFFGEGAGMLLARIINEQREQYPGIYLEAVLPHPRYCERFSRAEWELISKSNGIKVLCEECQQDYPLSVTRYLVGQSERVIAVCVEQDDRATLYSMDYARTMKRDLRIIKI